MANIKLKGLLTEAEDFKARSKETGKLVHFKSKDAYQAAIKAGSHEDPKAEKGAQPKADAKPNDMFGGDYAKDRGGEAPKTNLPKKASQLDYTHAETLEKSVNGETGLKGYVDTDEYTDAIMYNASSGANPTYTLYFGGNSDYNKPDEFRVSLLSTYGNDPSNIGDGSIDKTFKSGDDAMKFMIAVAKKYKKELQMDDEDTNESSKLTSMFKK
jgi:hypothetical protein